MINADETKRQKARELRYRKAIVKNVNLFQIKEDLYEIVEECDRVKYFFEDDETLLNALDGNCDDDTWEFKMMFADLCAECDIMISDLECSYVPEFFDDFFVSVSNGEELLGFDAFEGDYYGLGDSYEEELARQESRKRISRLTKDQIIEGSQACFRVFMSYIGLKHRYDCLKSAMDILRDENTEYLQLIKQIDETYEKANADDMWDGCKSYQFLDELASQMPAEAWVS